MPSGIYLRLNPTLLAYCKHHARLKMITPQAHIRSILLADMRQEVIQPTTTTTTTTPKKRKL